VRPARVLLTLLAVAALAAAALGGMTGALELAAHAGPLVLILALLLKGRYVGEERILAWRRAAARPRRRPTRLAASGPDRTRPLASVLARVPRTLRGPPRPAPAS
jgi:hypothetical protein